MNKRIHTSDYYVASLDLLGAKDLIYADSNDDVLNSIKNIYRSWVNIKQEIEFKYLKIKIFSDNIIIAIECNIIRNGLDNLLEFVSYMAEHFLKCGFKLRGGITKGSLYINDVFVWGKALVDAYNLESKKARFPRIIIEESLIEEITPHVKNVLISKCDDGWYILNYLKSFGSNAEGHLEIIQMALDNLEKEAAEYDEIKQKNEWLEKFLIENKAYWEKYRQDAEVK